MGVSAMLVWRQALISEPLHYEHILFLLQCAVHREQEKLCARPSIWLQQSRDVERNFLIYSQLLAIQWIRCYTMFALEIEKWNHEI